MNRQDLIKILSDATLDGDIVIKGNSNDINKCDIYVRTSGISSKGNKAIVLTKIVSNVEYV